jgi:uncharacterized membrane protein YhaH (DUF805 family)
MIHPAVYARTPFWVWVLVGCASTLGLLVAGMLAIAPVAVDTWVMASRPTIRRSAFGNLDPLPWLFIGVALFVGGIVAHARRR